ncbi:MAG: hypothetical protein ABWY18_11320 [Tardiphaga sp.]
MSVYLGVNDAIAHLRDAAFIKEARNSDSLAVEKSTGGVREERQVVVASGSC